MAIRFNGTRADVSGVVKQLAEVLSGDDAKFPEMQEDFLQAYEIAVDEAVTDSVRDQFRRQAESLAKEVAMRLFDK
jgi:hypothetical protein